MENNHHNRIENEQTENGVDLTQSVLQKIQTDEMHSKSYFTLKIATLIALVGSVLLLSIFICNYIFFSLRLNERDSLLSFGSKGLFVFLGLFPWLLLVIDLALILLVQWLLQKFRFGYRSPLLFLCLGLLVVTVSIGLFVDRVTILNNQLLQEADENNLPGPFNAFYEHARDHLTLDDGVCRCLVTRIDGNTMTVVDTELGTGTTFTIILPPNDTHATTSTLQIGDMVYIAGDTEDKTTHAFGVRRIAPTQYYGSQMLATSSVGY